MTERKPVELMYATPGPQAFRQIYWWQVLWFWVLFVDWMVILTYLTPRFVVVYFDLRLPWFTVVTFELSDIFQRYGILLTVVPFVAPLPLAWMCRHVSNTVRLRWIKKRIKWGVLVLLLLTTGALVACLTLPYLFLLHEA